MKKVAKFTKVKETKNTIKYEEVASGEQAEPMIIGQQYVQKSAFEGASPQSITITVEW